MRNRCVCADGCVTCGGSCTDLATDAANCGACGEACQTGQVCISGACEWPICSYDPGFACITTLEGTVIDTCNAEWNNPQTECESDADCAGACTSHPTMDSVACIANMNFPGIDNPQVVTPRPNTCVCYQIGDC